MTKKKACFITACDSRQFPSTVSFWNSMTKFHDPKDIDMILYTDMKDEAELTKLPEGIRIVDLTPYLQDPQFFYRQKPILMEPLLEQYDLVVGFDSDQIVTGDLSYIIETKDYDVATVINWNRYDPQFFGFVELQRIAIMPAEYFNCGLVALRSKQFAHNWLVNCYTAQFDRMQYKEQDILNIMCYYGNWNVRCLDHPDIEKDGTVHNQAFWGIIGKGEWNKATVTNGVVSVSKGSGDMPFPPADEEIKLLHIGGGKDSKKDNWGAICSPALLERINELIK